MKTPSPIDSQVISGLFELDQRAGEVLRVEEEHGLAVSAYLRPAVAQDARALAHEPLARRLNVAHFEAEVVDPAGRKAQACSLHFLRQSDRGPG